MGSTIGNTCLGDAVGYLLIETVGRGETATKIGKGINTVKGLEVIFISGMNRCRLKHHFKLLNAYCESKELSDRRQRICESLKVILLVGNDSTVISIQEVTNK